MLYSNESDLKILCNLLSPFVTNPPHSKINWIEIIALANHRYLVPALWAALNNKGWLSMLDPQLKEYLTAIYQLNLSRNNILLQQLNEIVLVCNHLGIEPILIKGAASLVENIYIHLGARFMIDLDILVPDTRLNEVVNELIKCGYFIPEKFQHHNDNLHHAAPMCKSGGVGSVELHRRITESQNLDDELINFTTSIVNLSNGGQARLLSPNAQILHNILHSEIHHQYYYLYSLNLRQLHHFIILSHYYNDKINWQHIQYFMKQHNYQNILDCYLYSAYQLFNGPILVSPKLLTRGHFWLASLDNSYLRRFFKFYVLLKKSFNTNNLKNRYLITEQQSLWKIRIKHLMYLLKRYSNAKNRQRMRSILIQMD